MYRRNKIPARCRRICSIVFAMALLLNFSAATALPKIYAVVIGITKYQDSGLNSIKYADADAIAFAAFLKSPNCGSTPADQITLLTNENATRSNVIDAIRDFSSLATPEDVLIIYFAGHGTNATYNNDFFLETYDTDQKRIESTATSAEDIRNILNPSQAKMTFWITDACNSGNIGPGKRGPAVGPSGAEIFLKTIGETRKGGFGYLASCQSQEVAQEDEKYGGGHGLFTYYLLEGLKGKADCDANGIITINSCYQYLLFQVAKASGGFQHPVLGDFNLNGNFPLSITRNFANITNKRSEFINKPSSSEPYFNRTISVNSLLNTHISVKKGETVVINASGTINVGPWVGISGPEGRIAGVLGLPITQYNIVKTFKHAVLMFKLLDADSWVEWEPNMKFTAWKDGQLIFQVNDNDQGNNSGAYTVNVKKYQ